MNWSDQNSKASSSISTPTITTITNPTTTSDPSVDADGQANDNSPGPLFRFPDCVLPFIFENATFDRASLCELRRVSRTWYRGTNRILFERVVFTRQSLDQFLCWAKPKPKEKSTQGTPIGPLCKCKIPSNLDHGKAKDEIEIDAEKNLRIVRYIVVKANKEDSYPDKLKEVLSYLPNVRAIFAKRTRDGFDRVWSEIDKVVLSRKEELTHLDLFPLNEEAPKVVTDKTKQRNLDFATTMLGSEPLKRLICVKMDLKLVDTFTFNFALLKPAMVNLKIMDLSMI
ncbi:hypothetical protein HDU76_012124, partial [Blyttiomyces sp. JEL0837]